MSSIHAPVVVVGAGLVGAAQALALAKYGIESIVIDKADLEYQRTQGIDGRVSAISRSSIAVLEHIDIWQEVAGSAGAIEKILVTENHAPSDILFDVQDEGEEYFGMMVENTLLRRALLSRMADEPAITILSKTSIMNMHRDAKVTITTDTNHVIHSDVLLVADGRYSEVRNAIGIKARKFDYDQVAVVFTIRHEKPHNRTAVEWFFPEGPLALLPMHDLHQSCIVLTEQTDMAAHLCALSEVEFIEELQLKMQLAYGKISLVSPRYSYPLNLFQAEAYAAHRAIVIGDAAHAIHPIAGQGVNLGYRDVAVLTELFVNAHKAGQDLGAASIAAHYERWRRFDATSMIATTDMLNRFFSNHLTSIRMVRRAGMRLFDKIKPVKSFFMMSAMGLSGDLPKILKSESL